MKKVLIIGSVKLPVPAVRGGAVPGLIEEIIQQNEADRNFALDVISLYDAEAVRASAKYPNTGFIWAKTPEAAKKLDRFNYLILKDIFHIDRLLSLSYIWQIFSMGQYTAKVLKTGDYDRVIFENSVPVLMAMKSRTNRKKYKDRYYLHLHAVPRRYYGCKKQVQEAKKLICVSDYVARTVSNDPRLSMSIDQTAVMRNCIDRELFHPMERGSCEALRRSLNIPDNRKIILFVGRLCAEKGAEELIDAFVRLDRDDCVLVIAGSNFYKSEIVSPFETRLKEKAQKVKCKVIFTGFVDYADIHKYYAVADVVVLPSVWEEPAGMTVIEAMACGKALITTDSGGIPEYVGTDNCVIIKRSERIVQDIAEQLKRLLNDPSEIRRLGVNAGRQAEKYNKRFFYEQFLQILKE